MTDQQPGFSREAVRLEAGPIPSPARSRLARRAAAAFKARELRNRFFARAIFAEPAWNMLLALYLADDDGRPVTASGLSEWSGCPPTTGLRWLRLLESERLVRRRPSATDRRMCFVELTSRGREALDRYFAEAPTI